MRGELQLEGTLLCVLPVPVRFVELRCRPVLCRFEVVRVLPPESFFDFAKAAPPVNRDKARRAERIVFMPYQCATGEENRWESVQIARFQPVAMGIHWI